MRKGSYAPWLVSERDFPRSGTVEDQLRFLVRYAILAPSAHNTQPWRFRIKGNRLTLLPDFSRALAVSDPTHRELYLSLGCALANLIIAARHFGFAFTVEEFPRETGDPVARVVLHPQAQKDAQNVALFGAITQRHSDRTPYEARPVSGELVAHLRALCTDPAVRVDMITDRQVIERIAALTAEATQRAFSHAPVRTELSRWVRSNFTKRPDGMPGFVVGVPDVPSLLAPLIVRLPLMAKSEAEKARTLLASSPLVAVLSAQDDAPRGWVRTGMVFERAWLGATARGLGCAPYAGAFEVDELHREVERLLGISGFRAQSLLRIGYSGAALHPSPRRSIEDVLR